MSYFHLRYPKFLRQDWSEIRAQTKLWLGQGLFISIVTIALLLLVSVIIKGYSSEPPVKLTRSDPEHLGALCPGDLVPVNNLVEVEKDVVLFYYISTMEPNELANIPGSQTILNGYPHPKAGFFTQRLPWTVPFLPPGNYVRVVAARGTDGTQRPSTVTSKYTIPEKGDCLR